jgi:hypothetical protein
MIDPISPTDPGGSRTASASFLFRRPAKLRIQAGLAPTPGKNISILVDVMTATPEDREMEGTISSVENHGSIVIVWLDLENSRSEPVHMDHRAFGWMVEGEGIESVSELEGRSVVFNGETIEFLDSVEVA